jgi:hypothetical protein
LITLSGVFAAYSIDVPLIGSNLGSPAYSTLTLAAVSFELTVIVVGTCASKTASFASSVPGTEASIAEAGLLSGILAKSGGRSCVA